MLQIDRDAILSMYVLTEVHKFVLGMLSSECQIQLPMSNRKMGNISLWSSDLFTDDIYLRVIVCK